MTDSKRAYIISIGLHVLLVVIAFFVYYEIVPEQLFRQIEILEFRMESMPAARIIEYTPSQTMGESGVSDFNVGSGSNQIPSRVELPRVTTDFDEPIDRIQSPRDANIATTPLRLDDRVGNTASRLESSLSQDAQDLSATQIRERPLTLTGDDYLDHLASLVGERSDSPAAYYLEGEILQRTIANEVIPEYPPGLQRNATVTIQFSVRPDGTVTDMIITKKDDPILEELSLESLSQWRFNSIPQNVIQKGMITFIYQLR